MTDDGLMLQRAGWESNVYNGAIWWRAPWAGAAKWWTEREAVRLERVRASREAAARPS